jgi:hypothetical protein
MLYCKKIELEYMKNITSLLLFILCFNLYSQYKPILNDTIPIRKTQLDCKVDAKIAKYKGNCTVSKFELKIQRNIFVECSCCEINEKFIVTSFEFYTKNKGEVISVNCSGSDFPTEVIDELQKLYSNQIVYFQNVKAKGPDGTIRFVPGLSITIK